MRPLVIRGGAAAVTDLGTWSDASLLANCNMSDGRPWRVLVEKQNRITANNRHPVMDGWTFCQFLTEYRKAEYKNSARSHGVLDTSPCVPSRGKCRERSHNAAMHSPQSVTTLHITPIITPAADANCDISQCYTWSMTSLRRG